MWLSYPGATDFYKFDSLLVLTYQVRSYTHQKHLHLKEDWRDDIHDIAEFPKFKRNKILIVHSGTAELTIRYHVRKQLKLSTTNFDQGIRLIKDISTDFNCFVQNRIRHESLKKLIEILILLTYGK